MCFAFAAAQDNSVACDFLIINVWRAVAAVCAHVGVLSPPSVRMVWGVSTRRTHVLSCGQMPLQCHSVYFQEMQTDPRVPGCDGIKQQEAAPTLPQTFCSLFFSRMCLMFALSLAVLAHSSLSNSISLFIIGNRNVLGMSAYPSSLSTQVLIICPVLCSVSFFFLAATK